MTLLQDPSQSKPDNYQAMVYMRWGRYKSWALDPHKFERVSRSAFDTGTGPYIWINEF